MNLCIYVSTYLRIYLFMYLSIYVSIYLCIYLSVYYFMSCLSTSSPSSLPPAGRCTGALRLSESGLWTADFNVVRPTTSTTSNYFLALLATARVYELPIRVWTSVPSTQIGLGQRPDWEIPADTSMGLLDPGAELVESLEIRSTWLTVGGEASCRS
jgi:hypothetical protein